MSFDHVEKQEPPERTFQNPRRSSALYSSRHLWERECAGRLMYYIEQQPARIDPTRAIEMQLWQLPLTTEKAWYLLGPGGHREGWIAGPIKQGAVV